MEQIQNIYDKLIRDYNLPLETIKKGQFLFREGEEDNAVYFIEEGEVLIMKNKLVLWSASSKELIGITSFFAEGNQYTFSAKVSETCSLYRIPNEALLQAIVEYPVFSRYIMHMLCGRINRTNVRVKGFLESPSRRRLISTLVNKSKESGSQFVNYQVNELAEMVGASVRLIKSTIRELESKKMIRKLRGKLEILDLRGLEIISGASTD